MIAGNQATQCYHRWLEIRINLLINVESKYYDDWNISVKADTLHRVILRYFAKFLLQGVDGICRQSGFLYLAPSLTLVGCLLNLES